MNKTSTTSGVQGTFAYLRRYLLALTISVMPFSWANAAGWHYHTGKGNMLCDALHKRLNRYSYPDPVKHVNTCGWNVMLSYPGFTEPPWEELELIKHEELVYQLLKYTNPGGGLEETSPKQERLIRDDVRQFIEQGGRMQLWRTRLISDFYSKKHPEVWTPPGLQNVIQLRYPAVPVQQESTGLCPDVPRASWAGGALYIVNDHLTNIHPEIGSAGSALARSTLVLFRGQPHFLSGSFAFELAVGRDEGSGPSGDFCDFRYTHSTKRN